MHSRTAELVEANVRSSFFFLSSFVDWTMGFPVSSFVFCTTVVESGALESAVFFRIFPFRGFLIKVQTTSLEKHTIYKRCSWPNRHNAI